MAYFIISCLIQFGPISLIVYITSLEKDDALILTKAPAPDSRFEF